MKERGTYSAASSSARCAISGKSDIMGDDRAIKQDRK